MRLKRNYYEVMGLSRTATAIEVKKKYHELARQFHPDRAKDKELAARLFSQINLAYRTLIDDGRRSLYDAGLQSEEMNALRQSAVSTQRAQQPAYQAQPVATPPRPQQPIHAAQSTARTSQGATSQGATAQAVRQPGPARPTPTAPLAGQAAPEMPNAATLEQWLDEANRAYFRNDRNAAGAIVNKLLKYNQKNADVLRLAGDIYADTGRRKEALTAYKKALAAQGPNLMIQEKINRLQSALSASSGGADLTANRSTANGNGNSKAVDDGKPSFLRRILGGTR